MCLSKSCLDTRFTYLTFKFDVGSRLLQINEFGFIVMYSLVTNGFIWLEIAFFFVVMCG